MTVQQQMDWRRRETDGDISQSSAHAWQSAVAPSLSCRMLRIEHDQWDRRKQG